MWWKDGKQRPIMKNDQREERPEEEHGKLKWTV